MSFSTRLRVGFALLWLGVAPLSFGGAFGRFGYGPSNDFPGWNLTASGIQPRHEKADTLRFVVPSRAYKALSISEFGQVIQMSGGARQPAKLRMNLLSLGPEYLLQSGLRLDLKTSGAPYLTWDEGSVGPGIPTPKSDWVLLSYRDAQPPVLFVFLGGPESLRVTGKPGYWHIITESPYAGWIRVALPVGTKGHATSTAAELGRLVKAVKPGIRYWTGASPEFRHLDLDQDPTAVVATWTFSVPGAVAPLPATMGSLGGYNLRTISPLKRLDAPNESGPVDICTTNQLRIRFPVQRIPTGRPVGVGKIADLGPSTASPFDVPSVTEIAMANLSGERPRETRVGGEETLQEFLTEAPYSEEPITGQRLLFGGDGKASDQVAAHSFLMQVLSNSTHASSEANGLLTSLSWRRDWRTWQFWDADAQRRRRVGALAAMTGSICPEPERRLDGAMFQAGLSGEAGLEIWKRRAGRIDREARLLEPCFDFRQAIFSLDGGTPQSAAIRSLLLSAVRVFGDATVRAEIRRGRPYLYWEVRDEKPGQLTLASGFPLELEPDSNLAQFEAKATLGATTIRFTPKDVGTCSASMSVPSWAPMFPPNVVWPRYSETR